MSSSDDDNNVKKRKKGVKNVDKYKHEIIKRAKIKGMPHINFSSQHVPARKTGANCECSSDCCSKFSEDNRRQLLEIVNAMVTKNEQDIYIQGLIDCVPVADISKRSGEISKPKSNTFFYNIVINKAKIRVCKSAYVSLFGLTTKKVWRLCTLKAKGQSPRDLRGKSAGSRSNAISGEHCDKIHMFIDLLPVKEIHYSEKIKKKYLSASLNVKILHKMFISKYPELENIIKYAFFFSYFKDNFNFGFGRPQIDVCSKCEELGVRIRDPHLNENSKRAAIGEFMVHKRRSKKFYVKGKEISQLCKDNEYIGALSIDYMQNLPLPHIPVQEVFYYRQLWLYEFCIHNFKTDKATFYSYHEGKALKGPNEVCTFLKNYIDTQISQNITELHIFSDSCPGQNRNNTVVRYLLALVANKRFNKIFHYFPFRGHSFNQCDRDFATVKRLIRREDRVFTPEKYELLIQQSSTTNKFNVKNVETSEIIDFKRWWPQNYKKSVLSEKSFGKNIPKDMKVTFAVTNYYEFIYERENPGILKVRSFIDNEMSQEKFRLSKPGKQCPNLPNIHNFPAYSAKIPINKKKIEDIKKLIQYIPGEFKEFYANLFSWPTTDKE